MRTTLHRRAARLVRWLRRLDCRVLGHLESPTRTTWTRLPWYGASRYCRACRTVLEPTLIRTVLAEPSPWLYWTGTEWSDTPVSEQLL